MGDTGEGCRTPGQSREQAIRFETGRGESPFADDAPYSPVGLEFSFLNSAGFRMARLPEFPFDGYFTNQ
jgi:hypothetical protein